MLHLVVRTDLTQHLFERLMFQGWGVEPFKLAVNPDDGWVARGKV